MKITWAPNPLSTTVELDKTEKQVLRARLEIEDLEERLVGVNVHLSDSTPEGIAKANEEANLDFMDGEPKRRRDERLDLMARHCAEELMGEHCGDCTCVPMSCMKCYAEQMMRVDTLGPIGKHELSAISEAFRQDSVETTAQAISHMENNPPLADEAWKIPHIERWTAERDNAIAYLKAHAEKIRLASSYAKT
jgi:hypothetical protein